jgi:DNA-binding MarR family transcriptional regulator
MPINESPEEASTSLHDGSDVVHQRSRLAILAALYEAGDVEFGEVRRLTKLSDGNLSRHLQTLEEAGLVTARKGYVGRRPKTWVQLTDLGRSAFEHEIEILRNVVANAESMRKAARTAAPRSSRVRSLGATPDSS